MAKTVLITGATGLVGRHLTKRLRTAGYRVRQLSRRRLSSEQAEEADFFRWDPQSGFVEAQALEELDAVIHLAGAGVLDRRWTAAYKQEIRNSRVSGIEALAKAWEGGKAAPKVFVSASGVGFYGDAGNRELREDSPPGSDFLARVCVEWEAATGRVAALGSRCVQLRLGIVLAAEGGAFPKMALPTRLGLGAIPGSGRQWVSWIHIEDLCALLQRSVEDQSMQGPYNAVAPQALSQAEMSRQVARQMNRALWLPPIPPFALKMLLGERASLLLQSTRASADRLQNEGFCFRFESFAEAARDLLGKSARQEA